LQVQDDRFTEDTSAAPYTSAAP